MKPKIIVAVIPAMPLVVVFILILSGIHLDWWVYVIIALLCPIVGGFLYAYYKNVKKKIVRIKKMIYKK